MSVIFTPGSRQVIPVSSQAKVCTVVGCERTDMNARGLCRMHYMRWFKTGNVRGSKPEKVEANAKCSIQGCSLPNKGHRLCSRHYQSFKAHGDAEHLHDQSGSGNPAWAGDTVGYYGMHKRTRQIRGSAKDLLCSHCESQAEHWAYDHADANEVISEAGLPYSTDPAHYFPLCIPCHNKFDNNQKL